MSKNLDETVRLQSDREEWKREIGGERKQRIAEGASSAAVRSTHQLLKSSAASFPGKNKYPRTHCSLIE